MSENRDLRFYQRYPAISSYYVIFEKMTFGPLPVGKFGNFRSINSIVLKTILRRCPHVTDKIVIAVVKYIEHPIAFLSELYSAPFSYCYATASGF